MTSLTSARSIRGYTKSDVPDEVALNAHAWVLSVKDRMLARAWGLMTGESRASVVGYWTASNGHLLRDSYALHAQSFDHADFEAVMSDFCVGLTTDWGVADLEQLGVAPTKYLDARRALVRLVIGVADAFVVDQDTPMPMIVVPMLCEEGEWRAHLPGTLWDF